MADTVYQQLREHLHYLGLRAVADQLARALETAERDKPGYTQFLHDLLDHEVTGGRAAPPARPAAVRQAPGAQDVARAAIASTAEERRARGRSPGDPGTPRPRKRWSTATITLPRTLRTQATKLPRCRLGEQ